MLFKLVKTSTVQRSWIFVMAYTAKKFTKKIYLDPLLSVFTMKCDCVEERVYSQFEQRTSWWLRDGLILFATRCGSLNWGWNVWHAFAVIFGWLQTKINVFDTYLKLLVLWWCLFFISPPLLARGIKHQKKCFKKSCINAADAAPILMCNIHKFD